MNTEARQVLLLAVVGLLALAASARWSRGGLANHPRLQRLAALFYFTTGGLLAVTAAYHVEVFFPKPAEPSPAWAIFIGNAVGISIFVMIALGSIWAIGIMLGFAGELLFPQKDRR